MQKRNTTPQRRVLSEMRRFRQEYVSVGSEVRGSGNLNNIVRRCPDDGQLYDPEACACDACFGPLRYWCVRCNVWLIEAGCSGCGAMLDQPALAHGLRLNDWLVSALHEVRNSVVRHLTSDTIQNMLGRDLYAYIGTSSGINLTTFALTADCIRIAVDALKADGQITVKEVRYIHPFLKSAALLYGTYRRDYRPFINISLDRTPYFLNYFQVDAGPFGYAHNATHWGGLTICTNVATQGGDTRPLVRYEHLVLEFATQLLSLDGHTNREEFLLREITTRIASARSRL